MGFIKTKADKELERRMIVKKTIKNFEKQIAQMQVAKTKFIESAKRAKLQGSPQQYQLAVSGLKTAMAQEKKAQEMKLNFELLLQMRDLSKMTSEFLGGMSLISKEMKSITDEMDFAKVQKQFESAMSGVERTTDSLEVMLDSSQDSFSSISSSNMNISDAEIEALVGAQAGDAEAQMDVDLDQKLNDISKKLSSSDF